MNVNFYMRHFPFFSITPMPYYCTKRWRMCCG